MYYDRAIIRNRHKPGKYAQTRDKLMLLGTIRVGPNTSMGVSRACDEAMATPSSVPRAFLDPFLRGVTLLTTEGVDETLANKAN